MELELLRTKLEGYHRILNTTVCQEESLESIVPDTCPDIARIVETSGTVWLRSKEVDDGALAVNGTMRLNVLYLPDGAGKVGHMEASVPFRVTVTDAAIRHGSKVMVSLRLCSSDAAALNPRKILLRGEIAAELCVYTPWTLAAVSGVQNGAEAGVEERSRRVDLYETKYVQEKNFTYTYSVKLPAGLENARELLSCRAGLVSREGKVIGNKLIVKGISFLELLCRPAEGELSAARLELPFSQIVELPNPMEDAEVTPQVSLCSMECALYEEPGEVAVTMELLAQAAVAENESLTVVDDLYGVREAVEPVRENAQVSRLLEKNSRRQQVRQFCESAVPVGTVLTCRIGLGRFTSEKTDAGQRACGKANAEVLFLSEDGALCALHCEIPVELELPDGGGQPADFLLALQVEQEVLAAPVSGGIDVRFAVTASYQMFESETVSCVVGTVAAPQPEESPAEPRPSAVLRLFGTEDSLWEAAKQCRSTVAAIEGANGLQEGEGLAGRVLLIPCG